MDDVYEQKIVIVAVIILVIIGCFLVLLFLIFLKQKNNVIRKKREAELHFKEELIKTQSEIQQETMKQIGREIHDNVGQKLTLSSLYLQQLVFENKAPQVNDNINAVNTIINESLSELRQISKSLTDDSIQTKSLDKLIEEECKKVKHLKAFRTSFKNNLKTHIESYRTKSILLRIVQEFIQNSIKHSQCKTIDVWLDNDDNLLRLQLKDNGIGFHTEESLQKGIGLQNIKKRVEMLNGKSTLISNSNGTTLTVNIPIYAV